MVAETSDLGNGLTSSDFPSFSLTSNFDLTSANNALYKLNSVHGGVILPRGTSIVGLDLRKTRFDQNTFLIQQTSILTELQYSV